MHSTSTFLHIRCVFLLAAVQIIFSIGWPDVPAASLLSGCYKETYNARDMGQPLGGQNPYSNMTRLTCACQCKAKAKKYAGVEYGGLCMCSDSYGKYGLSPTCCNSLCTGDPSLICGGYLRHMVIKTSLVDGTKCPESIPTGNTPNMIGDISSTTCDNETTTFADTTTQPTIKAQTKTTENGEPTQTPYRTTVAENPSTVNSITTRSKETSYNSTSSVGGSDSLPLQISTSSKTNMVTFRAQGTSSDNAGIPEALTNSLENMAARANTSSARNPLTSTRGTGITSDRTEGTRSDTTSTKAPTNTLGNIKTTAIISSADREWLVTSQNNPMVKTYDDISRTYLTSATLIASHHWSSSHTDDYLEYTYGRYKKTIYNYSTSQFLDTEPLQLSTLSPDTLNPPNGSVSLDATDRSSLTTNVPIIMDDISNGELCLAPPQVVQNSYTYMFYKHRREIAVAYTCLPGYMFDTGGKSRSAICDNGTWLPIPAQCEVIEIRTCSNKGRLLNMMAEKGLKCTTSRHTGVWHRNDSKNEDFCRPAPLMRNANSLMNQTRREVTIRCQSGYRFSDGLKSKVFQCDWDGGWRSIQSGCNVQYCAKLQTASNYSLSTFEVVVGTVVVAECFNGHSFPDKNLTQVLECVDTDSLKVQWNGTLGNCYANACKNPPPVLPQSSADFLHSASDGSYPYGTSILYKCLDGRRFENGEMTTVVTCSGSGYWLTNVTSCDYNRCPPVPQIPFSSADTWLAMNGTTVTYTCHEGYRFQGQLSSDWSFCDGQQWSAINDQCDVINCSLLETEHALLASNETSAGSVVKISCEAGYKLHWLLSLTSPPSDASYSSNDVIPDNSAEYRASLTNSVTCTPSGEWFPNNFTCEPMSCPSDFGFTNAYKTISTATEVTTYTTEVTYVCIDDFWFARDRYNITVTCAKDGTWKILNTALNRIQGCRSITCQPLLFYVTNTSETSIGTIVNVSCADRTSMMTGPSHLVAVCGPTGHWTPNVPECLSNRTDGHLAIHTTEAEGAASVGAIAAAVVGLVLAIIAAFDVFGFFAPNSRIYQQAVKSRLANLLSKSTARKYLHDK